MADVKISALTGVTTAATTVELEVNEAGTSKKATLAQLLAAAGSTSVNIATAATSIDIGASTVTMSIGGTTAAALRLSVNGADGSNPATGGIARFGNGGAIAVRVGCNGYTNGWIQAIQDDGTNNVKQLSLNPSGGRISTGADLQVGGNDLIGSSAGTMRVSEGLRIGADSTNNLLDDASNGAGTATLYIGNASINVTSDERVKSNIKPIEDGLSIVNALQPIEFDQDEERPFGDQRHYMGFGARASHKVAPWAVHTQGDTGLPWKMRQEFLMAPVVRAVQQLCERIIALEAKTGC